MQFLKDKKTMDYYKTSVLVMMFINIISPDLSAQPWYVALTGSDSNNGTELYPFRTIEKAVSVVQAGQTIYIKGIDITGAGDNGMKIESGSYNTIENCAFYRNRDSGLQLDNGASNNTIRNCDSYFNADPPDYGDADGFATKMNVGSGNYFYGCRSWRNCDDGFDGYMRGADDASTTLENCWAFENGYLEDGTDPGSQNFEIDVLNMPDGIYIYRVTLNENPVVTSKLIKTT
jgi:parallel beta-helix repeat protein